MRYLSTRGASGSHVSAAQAIVQGLAPDGGLFVPENFPRLTCDAISQMAGQSYQQVAKRVMGLYLDEFSAVELSAMVDAAYTDNFDDRAIAPLVPIDERESILELFHGPTLAFKDMALQMLPRLLRASIDKTGETQDVLILVATSGDTGKAALEGFADAPGTGIVVFYPKDGVSPAQELQMRTQAGRNVGVVAVEGNFDDAQTGVKRIFSDPDFAEDLAAKGYRLSSANSINWGRLLPQIAYYVWSYTQLLAQRRIASGDEVNFVVPTGNFGNILAAYYAKRMGLPVHKLICASNRNNVLTDFFRRGDYDRNRPFYKTSSPSMDILVSSNLERLLFELCDRDASTVARWMQELNTGGRYAINDALRGTLERDFYADCCDEDAAAQTIGRLWRDKQYLLDTHTAVAQAVYERYQSDTADNRQSVIVSTASPYKFAYDVLMAVDPAATANPRDPFEASDSLAACTGSAVPARIAALKCETIRHEDSCGNDGMAEAVKQVISRFV